MAEKIDNISTVDGVRAMELYFRACRGVSDGKAAFFQSQLRLNAPTLGVLLPDDYTSVTEGSGQCTALFRLAAVQLLRRLKAFAERGYKPMWISLYTPVRYLKTQGCAEELSALCERLETTCDKLCLEIPADVLFETDGAAAVGAAALSEKGFRLMLSGFGAAGCNIMGMSAFPFDYVVLDKYVCAAAGGERENALVKSLVSLTQEQGAEVIAETSPDRAELMKELGCKFYLSGDFCSDKNIGRYVR